MSQDTPPACDLCGDTARVVADPQEGYALCADDRACMRRFRRNEMWDVRFELAKEGT